jgi:hypothetical protein
MDVDELGEESLLAEARAQTGLSDFGGDDFREGLAVLLETYQRAGLTPAGRRRTRERLVALLANRLRIAEAFRRHPEVREREIRRPVFLTGLPRTGTSALFNLLAVDPASRPLLLWEAIHPDPCEGLAPGATDPRLLALREHYRRERERNPEFTAIHYMDADLPEECVLLLAHAFRDVQMGIEPLLSPYREWFLAQDLHAPYRYYRDLLRLLDWQRPGERWLLKTPAHLWALDVLVELFPDACIVQTHRDPLEILPSYCSMIAALSSIRERFDPKELGPTVLEFLAGSLERGLAVRERSDPRRFHDVDYRAFLAAPIECVERIYHAFQLELRPETADAMRRHVRENPQGKHGVHRYALADFGLDPETVGRRLDPLLRLGAGG